MEGRPLQQKRGDNPVMDVHFANQLNEKSMKQALALIEEYKQFEKGKKPKCPKCQQEAEWSPDANQQENTLRINCQTCGRVSVNTYALTQHMDRLSQPEKEMKEMWVNPQLMRYVYSDLSRKIKFDDTTKALVFGTGCSNYLEEPLNIYLKGESSTGKTYITVQTLRSFPKEDIWLLSGMSPKAIVHQKGILMDSDGIEINLEEAPIKPKQMYYNSKEEYKLAEKEYIEAKKAWQDRLKNSYNLIKLDGIILVFLEAPHPETLRMLYATLSHDLNDCGRRSEYKFTNKSGSGQLRTDKVILEGYPTAVFLSLDKHLGKELATRTFTASPEDDPKKIDSATELINQKASLPWEYKKNTQMFEITKKLLEEIKLIKQNDPTLDVILPFTELHKIFSKVSPRDMRDFEHFTQFVKAWTFFHIKQRPCCEIMEITYIMASVYDVMCCYQIFNNLIATTRTGTERRVLDFYKDLMMKKNQENFYVSELTNAYNESHPHNKVSDYTVRKWLKRLNMIGFVDELEDSQDKRKKVYKPLVDNIKGARIEIFENVCDYEKQTILASKLEKDCENWLKNICKNYEIKYKNYYNGKLNISQEDVHSLLVQDKENNITFLKNLFNNINNPDLDPKQETVPEINRKSKNQTNSKSFLEKYNELADFLLALKKDGTHLIEDKIIETRINNLEFDEDKETIYTRLFHDRVLTPDEIQHNITPGGVES